jgi:hypothetical protein
MYDSLMGLFSKKEKVVKKPKGFARQFVDLPNSHFIDSDEFVDVTVQGKETTFRVVRITCIMPDKPYGTTHEAIVARAKGKKEYKALFTIEDRKIVKSFVVDFYG